MVGVYGCLWFVTDSYCNLFASHLAAAALRHVMIVIIVMTVITVTCTGLCLHALWTLLVPSRPQEFILWTRHFQIAVTPQR